MFPSPLGVSYSQIRKKIMVKLTILFPSPLGVSYFQIMKMTEKERKLYKCFRPLSGYLISKYCPTILLIFVLSFRPLSGYLISKW